MHRQDCRCGTHECVRYTGLAVSPGTGFGPLGEDHVRFALVENEHRIRQATRGIKQVLKTAG